MSEYRKTTLGQHYFLTLTIVEWINVLDRRVYKDLLIKNLRHCQEKEGLIIYAYVIMSNHIHMVAEREGDKDLTELIGRFKSFTAKEIIREIDQNPAESRKRWLLNLFEHYAKGNAQYDKYHFWDYTNHPTPLRNYEMTKQKIDYIHDNPVRAGLVNDPANYIYSSACLDSPLKVAQI